MPAEHDLTEAIASVRLNPRLMSTAALVAAQAQLTRELGDRGVGGPLSDAVGAYAGVLTARALGGHVATVHPQGADVVTMEGDRVRVRTHLRQHPRRYGRAEFAALLVGEVRRAIVIDLHPRSFSVLRAVMTDHSGVATSAATGRAVVDAADITEWLRESARVLESLRGQEPDDSGLDHLSESEQERILAIDRIYFDGGNWLDDVKRLKIYPCRQG